MTNIVRKRFVIGLLPIVLVTAFLDEYYLGWGWSVLRWLVFIVFLGLWATVWQAWLDTRRAVRSGPKAPATPRQSELRLSPPRPRAGRPALTSRQHQEEELHQ